VKISNSPPDIEQSCVASSELTSTKQYFRAYERVVAHLPYGDIDEVVTEFLRCYERGRGLFLFGNGGSAALSSHLACDLAKGTVLGGDARRRFRVVALTDNIPLLTAWANDSSYERIFAEQLQNLVAPEDIAFGISGSGNSPNVLAALETARSVGAVTIGLTGFQGGKMKALCDYCIVVPSENMQIVEDIHLGIAHAMFTVIRQRMRERPIAQVFTISTAAK
jgi:D-sedoheptulose 7-phosphate isomerase